MITQVQTAQTLEKQEKFVIKIDKKLAKIIDSDTRKKLTDAYLKLFSGFAWVNWTNKQSLGRAWHNALGQCEGFIKTKSPSNPVTKYLKRTYSAHKKYWSRVIMTNQNSQNTLNKPENESKQMRAYGIKQIREAIGIINLIYEQFKQYEIEFAVDKVAIKTAETSNTQSSSPQTQPVAQVQEQAMPAVQKNVAQTQQQTAQPQLQAIAKPQKVIQPSVQIQQATQPVAQVQEQAMPAVQKNVAQLQQQTAQPQLQAIAKPQQVKQPSVQIQQAQVKVPEQEKAVAQVQKQIKTAVQTQPVAKVQEQIKPQQVPKPVQWQYAQIKVQQQLQAIAKPQQIKQPSVQIQQAQVKVPEQEKAVAQVQKQIKTAVQTQPVAKVQEQLKPQEQKITALKPVQETQIKQQQIKMFMFAKYNQKVA